MQQFSYQVTDQASHEYIKHNSETTLNCVTQLTVKTKSSNLYTQMDDLTVSKHFHRGIGEGDLGCSSLEAVKAREAEGADRDRCRSRGSKGVDRDRGRS